MRILSYSGLIFGLILAILTGILLFQRQKPSTAEWIFFSATPASQSDLYRYNPHTQELEQLSSATYPEILVTADPNGQFLYLLVANEFLTVDGYQVNLNGWHWRQTGTYPQDLGEQYRYQMSSDGNWLVVSYLVDESNAEIFLRDTHGDAMYPLTDTPDTSEIEPAWSPDGQWIVFISNESRGWSLYRMRANGSQREELVNLNGTLERPIWLPALNKRWQPIIHLGVSFMSGLAGLALTSLLWRLNR